MRDESDSRDQPSAPPPLPESERLGSRDRRGDTTDEGRARVFPCQECGADLEFNIGVQALKCPYCGAVKEIDLAEGAAIVEQDFHEMLARAERLHDRVEGIESELNEVRCRSCGGTVEFIGTLTSTACPYCASPIQREDVHTATHRIPVDGVLPFLIERVRAHGRLREWVHSRWFAPNSFLREGAQGKFNSVYIPFWTYDTLTFNSYSGSRGDAYWVTVGTGNNQRRERRVRWSHASGRFQRFFDDITVLASQGMNTPLVQALEPWPFRQTIPFTQQVLAGFFARTYDVSLREGFGLAKVRIDSQIDSDVRRRIGGDEQRVDSINTRYDAITFKHLLLPVWMLVYRHQGKAYQVFVNGGTGEVQGQRPYSWVKILLAILLGLAVVGIIAFAQSR
ncbi:MAG: hypothetical protein KF774_02945 [Planctomyces sp.]|nr:hypothetical protein [Planctomyces sp.]